MSEEGGEAGEEDPYESQPPSGFGSAKILHYVPDTKAMHACVTHISESEISRVRDGQTVARGESAYSIHGSIYPEESICLAAVECCVPCQKGGSAIERHFLVEFDAQLLCHTIRERSDKQPNWGSTQYQRMVGWDSVSSAASVSLSPKSAAVVCGVSSFSSHNQPNERTTDRISGDRCTHAHTGGAIPKVYSSDIPLIPSLSLFPRAGHMQTHTWMHRH